MLARVREVGQTPSSARAATLTTVAGMLRRVRAQAKALRLLAWFTACVLGVIAYEGPVANFMQENRQRHLAAQFVHTGTVRPGEAFALLQIGRIHLNAMVVEGDGAADLRSGPGHRTGTAVPGEPGEALIVGKASRYRAPFARLGKLAPGDNIVVQDRNGSGRPLGFTVTSVSRVKASAAGPAAGDAPTLTLVTGAPGAWDPDLVVVQATLVAFTPTRGATPVFLPAIRRRAGYYAGASPGLAGWVLPVAWVALGIGALLGIRRAWTCHPVGVPAVLLGFVELFVFLQFLFSFDRLIPAMR